MSAHTSVTPACIAHTHTQKKPQSKPQKSSVCVTREIYQCGRRSQHLSVSTPLENVTVAARGSGLLYTHQCFLKQLPFK